MLVKGSATVLKDIYNAYFEDRVPRMAAALSYYTVFSVAPLLVIAIAIAGLLFGHEAASGQISSQLQGLVGKLGAEAIEGMVQGASKRGSSVLATVVGIATLMFGATGVFGELQDSLNTIWQVRPKPGRSMRSFVRTRFLSFAMVFGVGFLLLVSLLLSAGLSAIGAYLTQLWPAMKAALGVTNVVVSFGLITVLFAMIYKLLPDVRLKWSDVWIGAAATSALFSIGKFAIGLYIGNGAVASGYGAVGSLAVFLIWIYFSSQAFLLGAEFTRAYARTFGSHVSPKPGAQWVAGTSPSAPAVTGGDAAASTPPPKPTENTSRDSHGRFAAH